MGVSTCHHCQAEKYYSHAGFPYCRQVHSSYWPPPCFVICRTFSLYGQDVHVAGKSIGVSRFIHLRGKGMIVNPFATPQYPYQCLFFGCCSVVILQFFAVRSGHSCCRQVHRRESTYLLTRQGVIVNSVCHRSRICYNSLSPLLLLFLSCVDATICRTCLLLASPSV